MPDAHSCGRAHAAVAAPPERAAPEPLLRFRSYAIAFHLTAPAGFAPVATELDSPAERALRSYERDMLLYSHRDAAPFETHVLAKAEAEVAVRFPPEVTYEAEGRRKTVRYPGATSGGRVRRFAAIFAETRFRPSRLSVLTIVLQPLEGAMLDSELNEFDVISLIKLWEGGETVADAPSLVEGRDVWFEIDRARQTLDELPAASFGPPRERDRSAASGQTAASSLRTGTLELELAHADGDEELFADVAALRKSQEPPPTRERWNRAVALGGIVQGLLDFREIKPDELADVFAAVDVEAGAKTLRGFHKGSLLSVSAEDPPELEPRPEHGDDAATDAEDRTSPIGIDPYLALPNIVLLHNEHRLKTARSRANALSARQRDRFRQRAPIDETEDGLSELSVLLAQHLPNVFHYRSERQLQGDGAESRGLDDLETFIKQRIEDLSSVLEARVRRRDRWTAVFGIAVGVVTTFLVREAIEGGPVWLVVPGAVLLFAVFLWLRNRLF